MKSVRLLNFAQMADFRGTPEEIIETSADTPMQLYHELGIPFQLRELRIAVNHEFTGAESPLESGDVVAFLPPFAGG
jgi:molybdopterin synthase sulfur carrier subunit